MTPHRLGPKWPFLVCLAVFFLCCAGASAQLVDDDSGGWACPDVWEPVCGEDGQTYSSSCFAGSVPVACEGECPCAGEEQLPYIELGPEPVAVLSKAGDTFQFTAELITPGSGGGLATSSKALGSKAAGCFPPFCETEASEFEWTSSHPEQVHVSASGRVTALTDDAFAVILVTLRNPEAEFEYLPAEGSVMVAELQKSLRRLSASWVLDAYRASPGLTPGGPPPPPVVLEVANNATTRGLKPGEKVLFGQSYGVEVVTVVEPRNFYEPVVIRGEMLGLTDVYEELNLTLTGDQLRNLETAKNAARGTEALAGWDRECGFELIFQHDLGTELHIEVDGGALRQFLVYSQLAVTGGMLSRDVAVQFECAAELPSLPVLHVPLSGFSLGLDLFAVVKAKMSLQLAAGATVTTPEFTVTNTVAGGIGYDLESGGQVLSEVGEPEKTFAMNSVSLDEPATQYNVTVEGGLGFEVGVRATLYLGPWQVPGLALFNADMAVSEMGVGRKVGIPWEAFLTPLSNQYRGPALADTFALDVYPLKAVGVDEDGWLAKLGLPLYLEGPKINLIEAEAPFPVPSTPSRSHTTVYVNGNADDGYPPCTTLQSVLSPWNNPIFPNPVDSCRIAIWPKNGSWAEGYTLDGLDEVYCPSAEMEGEHYLRAECAYTAYGISPPHKWLFPAVSGLTTLNVERMDDLYFDPDRHEVWVPVGGSKTIDLTVVNSTDSPQSFTLTTDLPSHLSVDGAAQNLGAGQSLATSVTVGCSTVEDVTGRVQIVSAADHRDAVLEIHCTLFDVHPRVVHAGAEVGESWTGSFQIENLSQVELDWIASGDVFILPTNSGTLAGGAKKHLAGSRGCAAKGKFTYQAEIYGSLPDGSFARRWVTFKVTCTDDGGDTWGDPHLFTYDGVSYDFQAPGEFVLSRSPGSGFEVQTRQVRLGVPYSDLAVNEAVAMNVAGDRVGIYLDPPAGGGTVMVDGEALDLGSDLEVGETYVLPNLGEIERLEARFFQVRWPNSVARVDVRDTGSLIRALNVFVKPPQSGVLEGLMGNDNGDTTDDFVLRDGHVLAGSPPSHDALHDCTEGLRCFAYDPAGGWWIRTAEESLFDYDDGQGPLSFAPGPGEAPPEELRLADFDAAMVAWAEAQCLGEGLAVDSTELRACMLDLLGSGDLELAASAAGHGGSAVSSAIFDITASSEHQTGWRWNVVDGKHGKCNDGEWATDAETTGSITLHFTEPTLVSSVTLFDRACEEGILRGRVEFSDQSPGVEFVNLPDDGLTGTRVTFSPRRVTSITVWLDETNTPQGHPNPGLGEILVNDANPSL